MENIVRKGEIACNKQCLLFSECRSNVGRTSADIAAEVMESFIHAESEFTCILTITKTGFLYGLEFDWVNPLPHNAACRLIKDI